MNNPNFLALVDAIVQSSLLGHPVAKEQIGHLGATPALLLALGLPDLPLVIKGKTIKKIVMDHGIPKSMVKRLDSLIASPLAVYKSAPPHENGIVVLSFETTSLGKVMLSIATGKRIGRNQAVNLVTSVYAKEDPKAFERWDSAGLRMWIASAP